MPFQTKATLLAAEPNQCTGAVCSTAVSYVADAHQSSLVVESTTKLKMPKKTFIGFIRGVL
jgi:hypothetical protein